MSASFRCRFVALAALLVAAGCMSTTVEPAPDLVRLRAESTRPAFGFDLRFARDPRLQRPGLPAESAQELDGEDLARETERFREALEGTQAFGAIERTHAAGGLHGTFELRESGGLACGGMFFGLSLGLIPDLQSTDYELTAHVSAPGKTARSYRVRTAGAFVLWLPLFPIGLVQSLTQRGELQQSVDAIVTQMAQDGWLAR